MATRYWCYYTFPLNGEHMKVHDYDGISVFKDGFWVNRAGQLAHTHDDRNYWIPPRAIRFIETERLPEPQSPKHD